MKAYKFRGPEQMDFVFDILFNKRLYCAEWHTLNDPIEGSYVYSHNGQSSPQTVKQFMSEIEIEKKSLRVCSLSATFDNHLLWAHYASGFTGVAIELDIDENEYEIADINYRGVFAGVSETENADPALIAREVLSSKYDAWAYENEVRVLTKNTFYHLKNPIKRVIVGHRMSPALFNALKIVCERLDIKIARTGIGDEGIDADYEPPYSDSCLELM